jgi:hypothetical protein
VPQHRVHARRTTSRQLPRGVSACLEKRVCGARPCAALQVAHAQSFDGSLMLTLTCCSRRYPRSYFARFPIPTGIVQKIVDRLRSDDVYDQTR